MSRLFITGCGRSGTSLVAGLFRNLDWYMGERLHPPRDSNPRGFFESGEINRLNGEILLPYLPRRYHHGSTLYGCDAPRINHSWLARIPEEVGIRATPEQRRLIARLTDRPHFCYKDTRFCYTIGEWLRTTPDARVICVFRHPACVVTSVLKECHSQPYLADFAISVEQAFELWETLYRHLLTRHYRPAGWLLVSYESILEGDGIDRIRDFGGAEIDHGFVDGTLNRSQGLHRVPARCDALYRRLLKLEEEQP